MRSQPNPYSAEDIWNAYGALQQSGMFPYVNITNSLGAVSWVLSCNSSMKSGDISFASALVEPFHRMERAWLSGWIQKYFFYLRMIGGWLRDKRAMKGKGVSRENLLDILVIIECCMHQHDLRLFDILEKANPGYLINRIVN